MRKFVVAVMPILFLLLPCVGCRSSSPRAVNTTASNVSPKIETPKKAEVISPSEMTVLRLISSNDFLDKDQRVRIVKAWKGVAGYNHYRLARADEFELPEWAKKTYYQGDLEHPYQWGELNGNYEGNLVAIVADQTKATRERFGLVVFIERKGKRYDVHWIYRDADLSHYTLAWHSGNVYQTEYREDGTSSSCDIGWSRAKQKFGCVN